MKGGRRRPSGNEVSFVAGADRPDRLPPEGLPEVAIAGRSNVGKSSLLNRLVGRRSLARVSKTPGRTQQINFFAVGEEFLLVDLPGYGFARVPAHVQEEWRRLVEHYLDTRRTLRTVVVLVDARRGVEADDDALLDLLESSGIPALLVVTKIDKLKRSERARRLGDDQVRPGVRTIAVSAVSGEGVDVLWRVLRSRARLDRRGRG